MILRFFNSTLVKSAIAIAMLATLTVASIPAFAQRAGERLYTLKEIDVDASQAQVDIDMTGVRGAVRALRLRTPSDPLLLTNVRVTYSDQTTYDEDRRINLLAGERTRPIDDSRNDRFVDRVTLFIDPQTRKRGTVRVQIIGHQTGRGRDVRRPLTPGTTPPTASTTPAPTTTSSGTVIDTTAETGSGEVLFGAQRVGLGLDRDTIRISKDVGKFRRFRLRVLENDVFLNAMTILYHDGGSDTVDVESEIKQGQTSAWFNLRGDKFPSEIQLRYRSKTNFKGRARVEVFGEFEPGWLGANGEGRRFNNGWVLLGAQTAGFVGFDNDVVPVGRNKGGFRQVRISVRDRAITLNELQIVYSDGTSETVPVKSRVDAGSTWGPVDIAGERRSIREIRSRHRSRFFDRDAAGKGAAIVEIWGRY